MAEAVADVVVAAPGPPAAALVGAVAVPSGDELTVAVLWRLASWSAGPPCTRWQARPPAVRWQAAPPAAVPAP